MIYLIINISILIIMSLFAIIYVNIILMKDYETFIKKQLEEHEKEIKEAYKDNV